ncbi:carboxypeptidase-like regulatory domain-containing protein [Paludibacter jiangxiensis]|uniref:CarboxypepD_reg-like domain-containing protein n=1 Tax=Paludibacter jiangxiensis TaxID=681398 RepID=A0A170Z921_9BACT|nr:carboxypeptidase-like regulatory domain-containing protein [Paludibacter jiangxiensis]GAT62433.1 CarboxypepD_reg-like domain-containing protein [Paludibacter jiangxiensis]
MTLKEYIQGQRKGKEANRIERQAMNDSFLNDAIEGFDSVEGSHLPALERLEEKVLRVRNQHRRVIVYWAMAASVLLLIGFGSFFLLQQKPETRMPEIATVAPKKVTPSAEEQKSAVPESTSRTIIPTKTKTLAVASPPVSPEAITNKAQEESIPEPVMAPVQAEVLTANQVRMSKMLEGKVAGLQVEPTVQPSNKLQGKVVDEKGEPLIGASVKIKGTNVGAVTDANGYFQLPQNVSDSAKLIAGYLGYENREVKITDKSVSIQLQPDQKTLSEVVVVGYVPQKKKTVVGSIVKIASGEFGEKEFLEYCKKYGAKNLCGELQTEVKVSFNISKEGFPVNVTIKKSTCMAASREAERLLSSSPAWSKKDRKVTMTISW